MKEIINCEKCKKNINNVEESITCNDYNCRRKYHKNCTNLNIDLLKLMETTNNCVWICDTCISLHNNNIILHQDLDRIVTQKFEKYSELNDLRLNEFNKRLNYAEKGMLNKDDAAKPNYPSSSGRPFKFIFHRKTLIVILLAIILGLLMTGFIFGSTIFRNINNTENELVETCHLVTRDEWQARPPATSPDLLKLPVHRVIISHTATEGCDSKVECSHRMTFIQMFHMDSLGMNDVGYNFLVGGDGLVYEARGWDNEGRHTKGYNSGSLGIAFIGTFTINPPTSNQLKAAQLLLDEGINMKKIAEDYKLYGARQLSPTESPGEALYRIIKTWPHWSNKL